MNLAILAYLRAVPKCPNRRILVNKELLDMGFANDKPGLHEAIVALYEKDCRTFIQQKGKCSCEINSKCTSTEVPSIRLAKDGYVYEYNPYFVVKKSN